MIRLALFASGSGTNVQCIADYFSGKPDISIEGIFCNRPGAYVLERATRLGIPARLFTREDLYETGTVKRWLEESGIDYIILAGFLWLVPAPIVAAWRGRIVNIHPALLPKYGGKGMYGMHVHAAVIASGDRESGITIHQVNERYDEGSVVFRATCPVEPGETPETLAAKVHALEHKHFPEVIDGFIRRHRTSG